MNMKKALGILIVGASIGGSQLAAAPLEESHVAKEAKWLAHIDVDALKESKLGSFAISRIKHEIDRNKESGVSIDVDMVLEELKSITAYGSNIENPEKGDGVIVLKTGKKLPAILDGFLAHAALNGEGDADFELLDDKPYSTYLFGGELYVSNPEEGLVMASKRFEDIENAYAVMNGKADNISKSENGLILKNEGGFFLMASVVGLSDLEHLPSQARILQKTTGAQVSIGEADEEVQARLVLGAASPKVSEQIFRIVQGMLALVSFAEFEDEGITDMLNSIDVQKSEEAVSINVRYSVSDLMELIENAAKDHGHEWGDFDHGETSWNNHYEKFKKWEEFSAGFASESYASNFSRQ